MCELCHSFPCHPRCPNASEPTPVMRCVECGEGIFEDDQYFDGPNGPICRECLEEKTVQEILSLFGERLKSA